MSGTGRQSLSGGTGESAYDVAMAASRTAGRPNVRRQVAESVFVAVASGCWTAVSGRSVRQRRLLRGGLAALAIVLPATPTALRPHPPGPPADDPPPTTTPPPKPAWVVPALSDIPAATDKPVNQSGAPIHPAPRLGRQRLVISVVAGVALTVAGRSARLAVERRWLRSLARDHRDPHLALGIRVGAVVFVGTLSGRLVIHRGTGRAAPTETLEFSPSSRI